MARNKYDIDETLRSEFNFGHLKRGARYLLAEKKRLLLSFAFAIVSIVIGLISPLLNKEALDNYIPKGNVTGLVLVALGILALTVFSMALNVLRSRMMTKVTQNVIHTIRKELFEKLQQLPFSYYDSRPAGKILVRVVNYVNNVSNFLSNSIINLLLETISLIFILGFMLSVNVPLTLVILAGLPFLVGFVLAIKPPQRRAWQAFSNKSSNMNAYMNESLMGMRVTQAFVREEVNRGIFHRLSEEYVHLFTKACMFSYLMPVLVEYLATWVSAAVHVAGMEWMEGAFTVGTLLAMTAYAGRFWGPIQSIANIYNDLLNNMAYLERIFELLDEPVDISDKADAYELPPIQGRVEFKDVVFEYEKGIPVIKKINFTVEPGQSVALVGHTGSGKTTIVNLISRFYDITSGQVLIDGHSVSDVTINSLRSQMGIMLQDSFIFSGTIRDNILYGRLDATQEEMEAAARTVLADRFIQEFYDGYDTEVNESGSRLSAGQRQLISFARTLLADPRILILDEATSTIDTRTERLLQEGLQNLLKGRTSFIIAHRLSTIRHCDKIIFLEQGNIMEMGTHDELMALQGKYYHLYRSQFE